MGSDYRHVPLHRYIFAKEKMTKNKKNDRNFMPSFWNTYYANTYVMSLCSKSRFITFLRS